MHERLHLLTSLGAASLLLFAVLGCPSKSSDFNEERTVTDGESREPSYSPKQQPEFTSLSCLPLPQRRPARVTALDVDGLGGCAFTPAGELSCWGYHDDLWPAAMSVEEATQPREPRAIAGFEGVELHIGWDRIYARTQAGAVRYLTPEGGEAPVDLGVSDAVEFGGAGGMFCVRRKADSVSCWLGGGPVPVTGPVPVAGLPTPVHALVEGFDQMCAIAGLKRELWCWGFTNQQAVTVAGLDELDDVVVQSGLARNSCAVRQGKVLCWGAQYGGEDAKPWPTGATVEVTGLDDAKSLVLGEVGCALRRDGRLACWEPGVAPEARALNWPDQVELLVGDDYSACAMQRDGTWTCWGSSEARGGGPCVRPRRPPPKVASVERCAAARVEGLPPTIALEPGPAGWCAIGADRHVRCWGQWRLDMDPTWQPRELPDIDDAWDFKSVGSGWCVRHRTGEVSCWNAAWPDPEPSLFGCTVEIDGSAQCSLFEHQNGKPADWDQPLLHRSDLLRVAFTNSRELGYCVSTRNGQVRCGRLGSESAPWLIDAPDVFGVKELAAADTSFCAIADDGSVWCWGQNVGGALGRPSCEAG